MSRKKSTPHTFISKLVYGYIREAEKKLNLSTKVPIPLQEFIVKYKYIHEYFETAPDHHFEISNDGFTITNIRDYPDPHQIWMKESVKAVTNNTFTWQFKINKLKSMINFGLMQKESCWVNDHTFWYWDFRPIYSITNTQCLHSYPWKEKNMHLERDMEPNPNLQQLRFGTGDSVAFTLNLKQRKLSCKINNDPSFDLFNNIEKDEEDEDLKYIEWTFVFSMGNKDDSISLLKFYQHT